MLKKLDQAFSKVEGFLSVVLFLAMVAIVCWSVICRYALKIPFLQSEELARYLMIYIVYGDPMHADVCAAVCAFAADV